MTQGIALGFLGAVLVQIAVEGAHVRYVADWMRWPVLVTGGVLVLLALRPLIGSVGREHDDHATADGATGHRRAARDLAPAAAEHRRLRRQPAGPRCLPGRAARRRGAARGAGQHPGPLPAGDPVELDLEDMAWRAYAGGAGLAGRTVLLRGFVSTDDQGSWYVARMMVGCCAADALALRIGVLGADAPPRDTWVVVTGTWVPGAGAPELQDGGRRGRGGRGGRHSGLHLSLSDPGAT